MRRHARYLSCSQLSEAGHQEQPVAQPATISEVSDVFSSYLGDIWNHLLKFKDQNDQKLALKDLKKLGIRHETLDLDGSSHA